MSASVLILGASARAAAFSALRAGLEPWCADLFADLDLAARCPVRRIMPADYPHRFRPLLAAAPPGPWMYTGALENHDALVSELARHRPLWGNDEAALHACRLPQLWTQVLRDAGLPCPRIGRAVEDADSRPWLVKPVRSAGGAGIRFWRGERLVFPPQRPLFLQEYIEGEPCAALYLGYDRRARLLGVTRQLVGEPWLHAGPFRYCGSIGPLRLDDGARRRFAELGQALAAGCGLRGLFGVDCVLNAGVPWPVEINPRYTASVEVLEHARGLPALALHRSVFAGGARDDSAELPPPRDQLVGKAILFARRDLTFPADGPWQSALGIRDPWKLPPFADIPSAGARIRRGQPVLTILVQAPDAASCQASLQRAAGELARRLFG